MLVFLKPQMEVEISFSSEIFQVALLHFGIKNHAKNWLFIQITFECDLAF
jgi:hypothetical protein